MKAQTEPVVEKTSEDAEGKTEDKPEEAKPAPEPEEKTMTLEEYRKQKKQLQKNPNAKVAPASNNKKKDKQGLKEREKKGRAARVEAVDFVAAPLVTRGGGRGERRGGDRRPRGDRRGDRKEPQEKALDLTGEEFPSLG